MFVMEIKRPGGGIPPFDPVRENRETQKVKSDFAPLTRLTDASLTPAIDAPAGGLGEVTDQFSKADLKNPQTLELALRGSIDELIRRDPHTLTDEQRANIGDWMQADPAVRKQIEKYLEKVLK